MFTNDLTEKEHTMNLTLRQEQEAPMDTEEPKRRAGRPTKEEAQEHAYPSPAEATQRRGHRLYRDGEEVILRVTIPAEMRRSIKIFQLRQNITADQAVTQILRDYFEGKPA
jgi:hypothetical protein